MTTQLLDIRHRDSMHHGGFAGLREHRLVMNPQVFGFHRERATHPGIGGFVYLADARFNPHGETHMHPHHEIDVISLMVEGQILHEGSLGHGQTINEGEVQVQRAGGEGFQHNEINPDASKNRMIQIWVLPEKPGQPAGYQVFRPKPGELTRIYGGSDGTKQTYASKTHIEIANLNAEQSLDLKGEALVYLTRGLAEVDEQSVQDGHLVHGQNLHFTAKTGVQMIVIQTL